MKPIRSTFDSLNIPKIINPEDHCPMSGFLSSSEAEADYANLWNISLEKEASFFSESWTRVMKNSGAFKRKPLNSGETKKLDPRLTNIFKKPKPAIIDFILPKFYYERKKNSTKLPKFFYEKKKKSTKLDPRLAKPLKKSKHVIDFIVPQFFIEKKKTFIESEKKFVPPRDKKSVQSPKKSPLQQANKIELLKTGSHETDVLVLHPEYEEYKEFNKMQK